MNNWNIPVKLEKEIRARDKYCVYCGVRMIKTINPRRSRKTVATWEHIINNQDIINRNNIARCCFSCNSSKGTKKLSEWIESNYCKKYGITRKTVSDIVKKALRVCA